MIAITAERAICSPKVGPDRGRVEALLARLEPEGVGEHRTHLGVCSGGILAWIWNTFAPNSGSRSPGSWPSRRRRSRPRPARRGSRRLVGLLGERGLDPGARLEVDAEVELLGREGDRADRQDHAGDREEALRGPVKSNVHCGPRRRRRGSSAAQDPRAAEHPEHRLGEEDGGEQRDDRADPEREREALDPGAGEDEEDERRDQGDHVRVDDRRDPLPVALGDRREHRAPGPHLLLDPLEDDDVRVGRDADRQDQAGDPRQRQRDRDQLDQGEEEDRVDEQPEPGDHAEEAVEDDQEQERRARGPAMPAISPWSSACSPRVAETVRG